MRSSIRVGWSEVIVVEVVHDKFKKDYLNEQKIGLKAPICKSKDSSEKFRSSAFLSNLIIVRFRSSVPPFFRLSHFN